MSAASAARKNNNTATPPVEKCQQSLLCTSATGTLAKKSLCKVSLLAPQRPCKFHNTRTGTENCRDVDCRLGRDRTHSSRRLDQQLIRRRQTVAGRRSVLLDISRTCDSRCTRRSLLRTFPETINRQQ